MAATMDEASRLSDLLPLLLARLLGTRRSLIHALVRLFFRSFTDAAGRLL